MHQFHSNFTGGSSIIKYRSVEKGGNLKNSDSVIVPSLLRFWLFCGFGSITFEVKQQFHSRFREGQSIIKYKSSLNLEVIHKLLTEILPIAT